ncbi:uncharacterized protein LOC143452554 [Clavelina lepadiformis]|uniref:uncharacterized protein LOC143452554 n=1 Tax=Clavelina lepadiformis TaxID=159417 RepID=UPI004042A403
MKMNFLCILAVALLAHCYGTEALWVRSDSFDSKIANFHKQLNTINAECDKAMKAAIQLTEPVSDRVFELDNIIREQEEILKKQQIKTAKRTKELITFRTVRQYLSTPQVDNLHPCAYTSGDVLECLVN